MVDFSRCAQLGTVPATVASASYSDAMLDLAKSVIAVGFPCLVRSSEAPFSHEATRMLLPNAGRRYAHNSPSRLGACLSSGIVGDAPRFRLGGRTAVGAGTWEGRTGRCTPVVFA